MGVAGGAARKLPLPAWSKPMVQVPAATTWSLLSAAMVHTLVVVLE